MQITGGTGDLDEIDLQQMNYDDEDEQIYFT